MYVLNNYIFMDKKDDFREELKEMIKVHKIIRNLENKALKRYFSRGALNLEIVNLDHLIEKK